MKVLAEGGILYDKRGIGKFVSSNALQFFRDKRKNKILKGLIQEIILEATHLWIGKEELIEMIKAVSRDEKEGE